METTFETFMARAIEKAEAAKIHYATYTEGAFQIYVIPVTQRTTVRKPHYRATFYLQDAAGKFKRTTEAAFRAALAAASSPAPAAGCKWFLRCQNPATGMQAHPILGAVPICDRCKRIVEAS